jgi:hypothetical protein
MNATITLLAFRDKRLAPAQSLRQVNLGDGSTLACLFQHACQQCIVAGLPAAFHADAIPTRANPGRPDERAFPHVADTSACEKVIQVGIFAVKIARATAAKHFDRTIREYRSRWRAAMVAIKNAACLQCPYVCHANS